MRKAPPMSALMVIAAVAMAPLTMSVLLLATATEQPYLAPRANVSSRSAARSSKDANAPVRKQMLDAVNAERKKRKLAALTQHTLLDLASQKHADDMARRKYFSHLSPEGKLVEDRIRSTGYFTHPCASCVVEYAYAENLARSKKSVQQVVGNWMQSAVHRGNILKKDVWHLGVGRAGDLWVLVFGGAAVKN